MNEADRELLEMAAKADGLKILRDPISGVMRNCTGMDPAMNIFAAPQWNPLTDDGEALRLAVKLRLCYGPNFRGDLAVVFGDDVPNLTEPYDPDPCAATRRVIVRAAAEIGKAML